MDVQRLGRLGWSAKTKLEDGFRQAYAWYVEQHLPESKVPA